MAESHLKSKLKRKRSFSEDHRPQTCSRGTESRSHTALLSRDVTAEPWRSVLPAAVWWNREQLPAVESLWALTLKSALPYLQNQHCDLVPDLPHPSTVKPAALTLDEEQRCDLSEEVAPLPEPSLPSPKTSSVQTKPAPAPPDRQLFSHSGQSQNNEATSLQTFTTRPHHSHHSWVGVESTAGPSGVHGEVRKRGEQREETGPVHRQLLTGQVRVSDRRVSLQDREDEVDDKEGEEVQRSVRGAGEAAGGGGLQSCPMCLLVFPAGFTQMDCDGHLAQCLSEVNVDVTW